MRQSRPPEESTFWRQTVKYFCHRGREILLFLLLPFSWDGIIDIKIMNQTLKYVFMTGLYSLPHTSGISHFPLV